MALLELKIYPDPILRTKAEDVTDFGANLQAFVNSMAETMYHEHGVGLAAPQVGVTKRVTVIDVSRKENDLLVFINPVITHREGSVSSEEGCLSIPDYREKLKRSERVVVTAVDRHGKTFETAAEGLLAICLQHEIDHLHGVLFIDHLSRLKKSLFNRWLKRQSENP